MITAYEASAGRIAEAAGVDLILVGDSAAMVVQGLPDTTSITLDEMVRFTQWVRRGAPHTPVVGDLPRGTYEESDRLALESAKRLMEEGGADLVKLEGGGPMVARVRAFAAAGVPVIGHLGLLPQSVHRLGGYKAQARQASAALALLEDAQSLAEAGAVAVVLEAIPPVVAKVVTETLAIPTIGIGAGPDTDGQVLVWHDLLGLSGIASIASPGPPPPIPRFVKRYADLGEAARQGILRFAEDVRSRTFPEARHTYGMEGEEVERFLKEAASRAVEGPRRGDN